MARVEVDGLPEARAALAGLKAAADRHLDQVCADSAEAVARRTRAVLPLGPGAGGHLRASVGVTRQPGMAATVGHGGPRFRYGPWIEFGGNVGRHHSVHRTWIRGGRYLFRMLAMVKPGIEPAMHGELREACRESGWNPRG
ncbi:MAG TPA: hypothetical protein VIU11_09515 [Nakamurella sp.]